MKKNIYKEIPKSYHEQLCRTLDSLEDTPKRRRTHMKKYMVVLAAAVLACASLTVAAVGLAEWHNRASARFGTEKDLEDRLTMDGVSIPQETEVEENGLKLRAVQAVRTDNYYYFLLQMTIPEGVQWNEDICFEDVRISDADYGCNADFVEDSAEEDTVLLEVQVYSYEMDANMSEICLQFENLVQTHKTEVTGCLLEGEWKLPLLLPSAEVDAVTFYMERTAQLGEHALYFSRTVISPFQICLYAEQERAMHAVWGHQISLGGVWYQDGTMIEESSLSFSMSGHEDEEGDFCFKLPLETAVNTNKIAGILLNDGEKQVRISLNSTQEQKKDAEAASGVQSEFKNTARISDLQLIYVRYDYAVLADGQQVYLWDARCGRMKELFPLKEYGFSSEAGGEFVVASGSQMIILPRADSDKIYLYEIASQTMTELEAERFWPWPNAESYKGNLCDTAEICQDADERYSKHAFSSQGNWYCLFSEDGSAENMKLKILK